MADTRQNSQVEWAFTPQARGAGPGPAADGTESSQAERATKSPAWPERVRDAGGRPEHLQQAWKRVRSNTGSPGIDGMTVEAVAGYLAKHWPVLQEPLLNGPDKPAPATRGEREKPDGGMRQLGIPTVLDRFIQQAVRPGLHGGGDRTFSAHSDGFRPGRSAHHAGAKAQGDIAEGSRSVVDIDLEKFVDRVNHDTLMSRLARHGADKRMLTSMRACLNAGVMENGLVSPTDEGTPQGGPLSPLVSHIVLDELDREREKRGHRFVRYADEGTISVRSERAGPRGMERVKSCIAKTLTRKINDKNSAGARPGERKFLGCSCTVGRQPKRRIAPQAVERVKKRVRA